MNQISISCPHCGESFGLSLDEGEGRSEFTVDCEICCRPMRIVLQIHDGEVKDLFVEEE